MKFEATVIQGSQVGSHFGIATANLLLSEVPALEEGVYLVKVFWPLKPLTERYGLLHFGARKTFGGDFSAEVHILDFSDDIYGKKLRVEVGKKLREVKQFQNADQLFTQIEKDVIQARKHFMREHIFNLWKNLSLEDAKNLATKAVEQISTDSVFLEADKVFAYAPQMSREICFVSELMQAFPEKKYFFPKVVADDLLFFEIQNYKDLKSGTFNILEPVTEGKGIFPEKTDLVLVPSTAIDKYRQRLGKGKGFYDRLILQLNPQTPTVSIIPAFGFVDEVPTERHDQPVDKVIVCEVE